MAAIFEEWAARRQTHMSTQTPPWHRRAISWLAECTDCWPSWCKALLALALLVKGIECVVVLMFLLFSLLLKFL